MKLRHGTSLVLAFGNDLVKLANATNTRHCVYTSFMTKVVKHIVEAYIIHRKLVEVKEEEDAVSAQGEPKGTLYSPLGYVGSGEGRAIQAIASIQCYRKHAGVHGAKHIESFLSNLTIKPEGDINGRMVTWLELYILYRIRGGVKPVPDDVRKSVTRATADNKWANRAMDPSVLQHGLPTGNMLWTNTDAH